MNKYTENLRNKFHKLELNTECVGSNIILGLVATREKFNNKSEANLNKLHPAYVTGFCEEEACFHLAIDENAIYKLGYYVNPGIYIALHKKKRRIIIIKT